MNLKKIVLIALFSIVSYFLFNVYAPDAKAITAEEIQSLIAQLQAQIVQYQKQLAQIQEKPTAWCYNFNVNLKIGDSGEETKNLQTALQKEGLLTRITNEFDEETASAVSGLQQKYRDEILSPLGIKYGTGFLGKSTRAKLNKLYGCGASLPKTEIPLISAPEPVSAPTPASTPACIQVITPAINPLTNECRNFSTPCGVPANWKKVDSCPVAAAAPAETTTSTTTAPQTPISTTTQAPISSAIPVPTSPATAPACKVAITCASGYTAYDTGEKDGNNCEIKKCLPENSQPSISGYGPGTLKVNETGTFTINASDPEKQPLAYSAFWGDGMSSSYAPESYIETAVFSHSYGKAGSYNFSFTVTDKQGLSAKTGSTVRVEEKTIETSFHRFEVIDSDFCSTCSKSEYVIYNAKVIVYNEKGNTADTKDTSAGVAVFENLPYGNYTVTISAAGFEPYKSSFSVGANFGTDTTVFLKKIKPFITVLSPNGGEVFKFESANYIKWNMPSDQAYHVELYLMPQGSTPVKSTPPAAGTSDVMIDPTIGGYGIGAQTLNLPSPQGTYSWLTSSSYPEGTYKIRAYLMPKDITRVDSSKVLAQDESDAPFSLAATAATPASSITVLSPNGGEKWQKGSTQTIKWNSNNVSQIYIKLRKGSDTYSGTEGEVSKTIANTGSLQWTIPTTLPDGDDYAIRVIDSTTLNLDDSDAPFSVVAASTGLKNTESRLANISAAFLGLAEEIKKLLGK